MSSTAKKTTAAAAGGGGSGKNTNPKKNPKPKAKQTKSSQQPAKPKQPPKLATDPPLECAQADFDALLGDAAGLANLEEASTELLDCARYGEVDACRAILDVWSKKEQESADDGEGGVERPIVDAKDASQSTSLHKACANGHTSTVQLLLSRGALHMGNDSGNTPLHWAAGSGHEKCVKLLLDHYDALHLKNALGEQLDVLIKNSFGRSSLTEGFTSNNTKTVEHLLNHDSAEEEKLIGGLGKEEVKDEKVANDVAEGSDGGKKESESKEKKSSTSIVHEFDFLRGTEGEIESGDDKTVLIRELPITHADNPFGQSPIEDTTGLGIWCASLVMSRWLASPPMVKLLHNKSILELGAGCGIPALTAAIHSKPKSVTITDLNPETVDNIRYNIRLNKLHGDDVKNGNDEAMTTTTASSIDWGDESTYPPHKLDYVICSDCIYQKDIVPLLKKVVTGLLHPNHGSFLYVAPDTGRDGLPEFIAAMKVEGFECVKEEIAPDGYRSNPLKSGDEEDCFLHFHELGSTVAYVLYEFRRC